MTHSKVWWLESTLGCSILLLLLVEPGCREKRSLSSRFVVKRRTCCLVAQCGHAHCKKLGTLLDLCVSSLRRGHANLLCIVPILSDDPRRESKRCLQNRGLGIGKHMVHTSILPTKTLQFANLQPSKPNSQRHHVDIHSSPCNLCKHLHLLLL